MKIARVLFLVGSASAIPIVQSNHTVIDGIVHFVTGPLKESLKSGADKIEDFWDIEKSVTKSLNGKIERPSFNKSLLSKFKGNAGNVAALLDVMHQLEKSYANTVDIKSAIDAVVASASRGSMDENGNMYRGGFYQKILDRPEDARGGLKAYNEGKPTPFTREQIAVMAFKQDRDSWIGIDTWNFFMYEMRSNPGEAESQLILNRSKEGLKASDQFFKDRCQGVPREDALKKYFAKVHEIYANVNMPPTDKYFRNWDQVTSVPGAPVVAKAAYCQT